MENYKYFDEKDKKLYLEAKEINKKIFENNIEIYINGEKMKFDYKYKEKKEIKVKFKLKQNLTNTSFMFYNCYSLNSINFS